jgi:hypothetical protein
MKMDQKEINDAITEALNNEWLSEEVAALGNHLQSRGLSLKGGALVMSKLLTTAVAAITLGEAIENVGQEQTPE